MVMHTKHLAQDLEHSRSLIDAPPFHLFFLAFPLWQWYFKGVLGVLCYFNSSNIYEVSSISKAQSLVQGIKKWTTETLIPTVTSLTGALEVPMGSRSQLVQWAHIPQGWPTVPVYPGLKKFLEHGDKIRKVLGKLQEELLVALVPTPQLPIPTHTV